MNYYLLPFCSLPDGVLPVALLLVNFEDLLVEDVLPDFVDGVDVLAAEERLELLLRAD